MNTNEFEFDSSENFHQLMQKEGKKKSQRNNDNKLQTTHLRLHNFKLIRVIYCLHVSFIAYSIFIRRIQSLVYSIQRRNSNDCERYASSNKNTSNNKKFPRKSSKSLPEKLVIQKRSQFFLSRSTHSSVSLHSHFRLPSIIGLSLSFGSPASSLRVFQ